MLPDIYLAIDNCFASKRWTKPLRWMEVCRDIGVYYVEASADTECDPLYTTSGYLREWTDAIRDAKRETGITVFGLYSGHGTYATLGLGHDDRRIRKHILYNWLFPMIDTAAALNAGLGFFCHAFSEEVLKEAATYYSAENELCRDLCEVSSYAANRNLPFICTEQMYSPHQFPWTIPSAKRFLRNCGEEGAPMYITLDTGHQTGQRNFLKPSRNEIDKWIASRNNGTSAEMPYLGTLLIEPHTADTDKIIAAIEEQTYLFAESQDGEPYSWLRHLGCYSPVIHLQQTDGTASAHLPFTSKYNESGIINGEAVLRAIHDSYTQKEEAGLPPKCKKIYLTLEIFAGTGERNADILEKLRTSVAYWRQFIPHDGINLSSCINTI
ncbi:MAG: hypothetical protein E7665_01395 [Ruminococcaceae bacterium]|nr:hypothetical protein [Oscillospiraceae bacterium]